MTIKHLAEYATTERQKEIAEVYEREGSERKAAAVLGVNKSAVNAVVSKLKARAAIQGDAPGHWTSGTAPGFRLGKVTIQRGMEGEIQRTWERQLPEVDEIREALGDMVAAFSGDIKKASPSKPPSHVDTDLMNNVVIGDPHLDMLAYDRETGSNWDSVIAEEQHITGVVNLLGRAIKAHTGMLTILGDSLHRDSLKAMTPGSGTLVDVDGRISRSLETAVRLFRTMIDQMLKTHEFVVINFIRGNHSETLELCLRMMLEIAYENEPRVKVLDNTCKHVPFVFGANFLLTTHGDKLNDQKKADIAVGMYRDHHGGAKFTHILSGHIHHATQKEVSGCLVETFQALPTPDAWHTESGYVTSDQSISLLTYHRRGGIVSTLREYPRIYMNQEVKA